MIYLIQPKDKTFEDFLQNMYPKNNTDCQYLGDSLVIEHRYINEIIDFLKSNGFEKNIHFLIGT